MCCLRRFEQSCVSWMPTLPEQKLAEGTTLTCSLTSGLVLFAQQSSGGVVPTGSAAPRRKMHTAPWRLRSHEGREWTDVVVCCMDLPRFRSYLLPNTLRRQTDDGAAQGIWRGYLVLQCAFCHNSPSHREVGC